MSVRTKLAAFAILAIAASILFASIAVGASAKPSTTDKIVAQVIDPGDGGSGYPWNTGQCAYKLGNLGTWLQGGYSSGWGYWCDSAGLISLWTASGGWRYLGWD